MPCGTSGMPLNWRRWLAVLLSKKWIDKARKLVCPEFYLIVPQKIEKCFQDGIDDDGFSWFFHISSFHQVSKSLGVQFLEGATVTPKRRCEIPMVVVLPLLLAYAITMFIWGWVKTLVPLVNPKIAGIYGCE